MTRHPTSLPRRHLLLTAAASGAVAALTSGADGARRVSQVASVSTGDPDRPDLRTYQASPGLPVLMLVMTPAPFISDSDVTELRRGPRQPNGNVRGIDRHAETRSQ